MSVDLGHEFFKVALMRQGAPLEIVLNTHSKRKTTTAVSFFETVRTFGDDALAHQGKAPAKVPMFFHSTVGRNYSVEDISDGGKWWSDFGLGSRFYSHSLGFHADRGVPTFKVADSDLEGEELLAHIFHFCKKIAEDSGEGKAINVRDLVVTVPSDATQRQRQAIIAAGEIAGLRVLTLVHEGAAFGVQRAFDYQPEAGTTEIGLFYNLGSRKAEVSVIKFESRQAGMVKGKTAPVVTVLGSAIDFRFGGHLMDLKIADVMLKRFQEKYPKLADGVQQNSRALRKLLSQAQKTKAILSSNKVAPFIVESLFEDTDFQATIQRTEFEEMCQEMLDSLTEPIEKALAVANVTMEDIHHVEVIGGAWRVPKVQQVLSDYIEKGKGTKLPLGQHLNGEEAAALGAALVAGNSSSSFRVKKIFFTDITQHDYAVQVASLTGEWEKNYTVLYPKGTPLGGKKKLAFELEEDFLVRIFEDGTPVSEYTVTGLQEILEGKWKEYNMTGKPKISVTVPLELSGLIEFKTPMATVEEAYWVNVTKPKPKETNTTGNATGSAAENASSTSGAAKDETKEEAPEEANSTMEEAADPASAASDDAAAADDAAADKDNASEPVEPEAEVTQKLKKKKHEKKLKVTRKDFLPAPLSEEQIKELKKKLEGVAAHEAEIQAVAGIKNELEAAIYGSRDKLEREDIVQVTTEEQREEVSKMATDLEDWMYEAGNSKSEYEQKLQALQDLLGPMEERAQELEARSGLAETVAEAVEDMKKTKELIETNMTWVNASKVEAAAKKMVDFEEWWTKKHESQASLPLHEAPAYTAKEVHEKIAKVQKDWDKLKKTKKPKEKAPKADKKAKANATETSEKSKPTEELLPADIEATEKEIADIRTKKVAAVEKEDFDTAHKLKGREQALVQHLERLQAQKSEL